jgi:hypothetical protein
MSYDLYFWRQTREVTDDPNSVLNLLSEDRPVTGITAFPTEKVRQTLTQAFPEMVNDGLQLLWEGAASYFLVNFGYANERHVHLITVSCGYELLKTPDVLNRLVEACAELGCALYDPQVGKRFEQPEPSIPI